MIRLKYILSLLVIACSINAMDELVITVTKEAQERVSRLSQVATIRERRKDLIQAGIKYISDENFETLMERLAKEDNENEKERLLFTSIASAELHEIIVKNHELGISQEALSQNKQELAKMEGYKDLKEELSKIVRKQRNWLSCCSVSFALALGYAGVVSLIHFLPMI